VSDVLRFAHSKERPGQVSAVLRRVADIIEARGDVQVRDITFRSEVVDGTDSVTVTVSYVDDSLARERQPNSALGQ
jgi:hypothetical protein